MISTTFASLLLSFGLTNGAVTRPTSWYVSLHTAAPGTTGANELTSAAATGYARQSLGSAGLTVASGAASNAAAITFVAGGTWPAVTYMGLWDAASGGNFLCSMAVVQYGAGYSLAAAGIASGGAAYASGDVGKTVSVGATGATVTITAVSGGAVTGVSVAAGGNISGSASLPSSPVATSGGATAGSGLSVDCRWSEPMASIVLNNGDSFVASAAAFAVSLLGQLTYSPA